MRPATCVVEMLEILWLVPVLPFAGFLVLALAGRRLSRKAVSAIGAGSVGLAALAALIAAAGFLGSPPAQGRFIQTLWQWVDAGSFSASFGLCLDALSLVMMLVVTGVGFLIHVYSTEYMAEDPDYCRFFASMNLFVCSMLFLVLGDNLLLLYLGWEGVGLCSFLLIGFWYKEPANGLAARKAFIVTRVGDTAMALGLFLLFWNLKSLDIQTLLREAKAQWPVGSSLATATALLLLGGAVGKSAQLPLQTWLPDAMAGPTPVSALIHAATMVTAGVYLIARTNVIWTLSPDAMLAVSLVGAATLLVSGTSALVQTDIKRVLAYSTISQLGYMFLALGVGAWSAAMFHFMTHAFFKALLFLGAGSVIHSMSGEQDMGRMGGLARRIPVTWITFMAGGLALAGVFPFAGFWSKDEILGKNFQAGVYVIWAVGIIAAGITAFYTFRMIFVTFWGKETRSDAGTSSHIHESPRSMTVPLILLGVASTLGGFLGLPGAWGSIQKFLEPVFVQANAILGIEEMAVEPLDIYLMLVSLVVALFGVGLAWYIYVRRAADLPATLGARFGATYRIVYNKFYIDEFYQATFVWLAVDGSRWVWHHFDERVIDGSVNGVGWLWQRAGALARPIQTGRVQNYLLAIFIGLFVAVTLVVVLR